MKKVLALILVLALAFSFAACKTETTDTTDTTDTTSTQDPIIVGSIQDISSETSVMGLMIAQGIRWQVQCINDAGGINGRQIKLVEYDSKANVDESINAYKRLVSEGAVAVIGPHQANIGIALAPISQETKVPIICMGMDNRVTRQGETGTGDPWSYMFLMQPSCDLQGALMAKFAINDLGYKKFGVLYRSDNSYSYSLYYAFKAYCEANGAEIVAVETFQSGDTDFKTMLSKLIASDMECLFCPNYTGELVSITQQARGLGYDGPMINGLDAAPPFNTLCGAESENVYFISNIRLDDPDVVAVVDAFRKATGNDEPNQINKFCVGYDMMGALASVMTAGATDAESIRTGMENLTGYQGLTGVITINPKTHQPSGLEMIMHKIENGENVPIKAYTAEPVAY
ncbi:MAG: ABC transporter substrate-binding protein [Oscillospiraceae bacterium]|nr:ABC transporter substrate-binding protein [Oscillospiraceae bacterium]